MVLRVFGLSLGIAVAALLLAFWYGGLQGLALAAILGVLEVSLSFDNAVINATILQRMSRFWQRMFLTVGIVIAVFGMRLLFPLAVVSIGAHLSPFQALDLALHPPPTDYVNCVPVSYKAHLEAANPKIAAYGGTFLLLLFLNFIFTKREVTWLSWIERPMARLGRMNMLSVAICLIVLSLVAGYIAPDDKADVVMVAGVLGVVTYIVLDGISSLFGTGGHSDTERHQPTRPAPPPGPACCCSYTWSCWTPRSPSTASSARSPSPPTRSSSRSGSA